MNKLKGVAAVVLGAASYGLLATVVKFGNLQGLDSSALTFLQYLFGFLALLFLSFLSNKKVTMTKASLKSKLRLMIFGTTLGLTSCFYYLSIQYVPVSIAIILLMQAIWMGGVLEIFLDKTKPDILKILGSIVVLLGTVLAVDIFGDFHALSYTGLAFGILASMSFTVTLTATNRVESDLPIITRSKYLVLGGLIIVMLFWNVAILENLNLDNSNLWLFGLFLALFGAVIPPILLNKGFPVVGIGLGSILASIEIPVSIFSAKLLLDEQVKAMQWIGVLIIILSVVLINFRYLNNQGKV